MPPPNESNGTPPAPRLTLAAVLAWVKDTKTTDAERQAAKSAIQQFQNDKFGAVGSHTVAGRLAK